MDMRDFFEIAVPILISFATLLTAIASYRVSSLAHKLAKEKFTFEKDEKDKENRPSMTLESVIINTDDVDVYVGSNLEYYEAKPIEGIHEETQKGYNHIDLIKESNRLEMVTLLFPEDHKLPSNDNTYMFINACSEIDVRDNMDNAVLVFGALNITIDLDNSNISELKLEKAYSMKSGNKGFGENVKFKIKMPTPKPVFTIPIAYACMDDDNMSINLRQVNKLRNQAIKDKKTKKINFMVTKGEAGKYLSFSETAYLFRCKTKDVKFYDYTLLLEKEDKKLKNAIIYPNSDEFDRRVKGREDIVKYAIDYNEKF